MKVLTKTNWKTNGYFIVTFAKTSTVLIHIYNQQYSFHSVFLILFIKCPWDFWNEGAEEADLVGNQAWRGPLKDTTVVWDNHTIVLFTLSKICLTFTAGTQPSLTMVMIPVQRVWQPWVRKCQLKHTQIRERRGNTIITLYLHQSSGSWPRWKQQPHLSRHHTEPLGSCVPVGWGKTDGGRVCEWTCMYFANATLPHKTHWD